MRSSKSRSRGNKNRNNRPTGGNVINRVFDSSGPDGKVRGTPQQIIEKYLQLHRDAQLAGDRVNAENFAQHAEHYSRMLAEAQREVDRAREEQEAFNRERQAERDRERERNQPHRPRGEPQVEAPADPGAGDQPEVIAADDVAAVFGAYDAAEGESALVDLPEGRPAFLDARARDRRPRRERPARPADEAAAETAPAAAPAEPPAAEAEAKPARERRPRKPRAPRAEGGAEGAAPDQPAPEAAE